MLPVEVSGHDRDDAPQVSAGQQGQREEPQHTGADVGSAFTAGEPVPGQRANRGHHPD